MKTILVSFILTTLSISAIAQGYLRHNMSANKTLGSDAIVAVVEDRAITKEEVMREVQPFIPQIRSASTSEFDFEQRVRAYASEIIQNIIDRELIVKDFTSKGMNLPQSYLDSHFDDYIKREFNGDRAELLRYVKTQGKTIKQFREEQRKDIIVNYMKGSMRQTAAQVSPKKIREYYEQNKQKWYSPASANIRMITLKTSMNSTLESNRKIAQEIMIKLKAGEDFASLAKTYSKDDSSAKGGEWGWYKKGQLNPALDTVLFKLKAGEYTQPIEIGDSIFILKAKEMRAEGVQKIDDVREQIEWAIVDKESKIAYAKWIEDLRAKAYIKLYQ